MTIKNKRKNQNKKNISLIDRLTNLQYRNDMMQYKLQLMELKMKHELELAKIKTYEYIKQKKENV